MRCSDSGAVKIRPHHGMCLAFFEGKGYSEAFAAHMGKMLELFEQNIPVRLAAETDEICSCCPNNQAGVCQDREVVKAYDDAVLQVCGLKEGQELAFLEFAGIVQERIIGAKKRAGICGKCQWNGICSEKKSRWENEKDE